jgi:methylated-DNA-[protein]-cysteine S-methyltransferase
MPMTLLTTSASHTLDTPVGPLTIVATGNALTGLAFGPVAPGFATDPCLEHPVLRQAVRELVEYFAGERRMFSVPVASESGSVFDRRAWEFLKTIPYGQTTTYGHQASMLGAPSASRAVGGANGRNPIAIIVPCHRVIGANGSLTGFGGGVERKRWLLDHERRVAGLGSGSLFAPVRADAVASCA